MLFQSHTINSPARVMPSSPGRAMKSYNQIDRIIDLRMTTNMAYTFYGISIICTRTHFLVYMSENTSQLLKDIFEYLSNLKSIGYRPGGYTKWLHEGYCGLLPRLATPSLTPFCFWKLRIRPLIHTIPPLVAAPAWLSDHGRNTCIRTSGGIRHTRLRQREIKRIVTVRSYSDIAYNTRHRFIENISGVKLMRSCQLIRLRKKMVYVATLKALNREGRYTYQSSFL